MSQAATVSITRQNNAQSKEIVFKTVNWSRIRVIAQSVLLVFFPLLTIILSVSTDFLYITEIITAVTIFSLVALVRLIGDRS